MGLVAKGANGMTFGGPTWETILAYDLEIRANAYKWVTMGMSLKDALRKAWLDPVIKERNFTTPLAFSFLEGGSRKRSWDTALSEDTWGGGAEKQDKGGKGKGKGKKGKGKNDMLKDCKGTTEDGKRICFDFNNSNRK